MSAPLRVHFDQNCMNARGTDQELQAIQRLHDGGLIVLLANVRNVWELGDPQHDTVYKLTARERLARLEQTSEAFRFNVSPLGSVHDPTAGASFGSVYDPPTLDVSAVWAIVFPGQCLRSAVEAASSKSVLDRGQNSIHDVMHIVNAHDGGADVLLTNEHALLDARTRLAQELSLRPKIESPAEFLCRFPSRIENA